MALVIRLEVVTPERVVVNEDVLLVTAPGTEGEFGVLVGHTPFLTTLKVGSIRYREMGGQDRYVFVSGGFAEVLPQKVTVLAESAERRRDIDVGRAKAALERAQKRLESKEAELDFERALDSLRRAQSRLSLAETAAKTGLQ